MVKNIIALNGITGAGKSTIGQKLAQTLDYYFIDSDQEIQDRLGKTINQIFEEDGEAYFRKIEKELIFEIVSRNEKLIIALGGGSCMDQEILNKLKEKATTIWLKADLETIMQRLKNKTNRPLLNNGDKRKILLDLIEKRTPIYCQSDMAIEIDNKEGDKIVQEIINLIK